MTTDVTEHRMMQAKLERAERLAGMGTLAAGVAHEINNPLTFIGSSVTFVAQRLRDLGHADPEIEAALADSASPSATAS